MESTVGIAYHDDPEKAVNVIRKTLEQFSQISSNPPPQIGIEKFGDIKPGDEIECFERTEVARTLD